MLSRLQSAPNFLSATRDSLFLAGVMVTPAFPFLNRNGAWSESLRGIPR